MTRSGDPVFGGQPTRRVTVVAVTLAVILHVAIALALGRGADGGARRPAAVEGFGDDEAAAGGMNVTRDRNRHAFRVLDWESGKSIARARVTDVLAGTVVFTDGDGLAQLPVRPGAKLVVHVERPGFALHAAPYANTSREPARHTVRLERAAVPYALVDTIFLQRCIACHGPGQATGVDLTSHGALMRSRGRFGPLTREYNPDSSRLVRVLVDTVGPDGRRSPHVTGMLPVPDWDVEVLAEWIRQGARPPAQR